MNLYIFSYISFPRFPVFNQQNEVLFLVELRYCDVFDGMKCRFSRYESDYRSARPERDFPATRDYPSYRARDYPSGERDYGLPPRERSDYPSYYSPPREYPPASDRDYLPPRSGRDCMPPRADSDFDMPPRRYASR